MRIRVVWLAGLALLVAGPARAQTPWERYLELPSPGNARNVQQAAYSDTASNVDRLLDDLQVLEDQMSAGDSDAVRLALRLVPDADGAFGETLATMLGRLVRIHPSLLLRELRAVGERQGSGRSGFCFVVSVSAPELVDRTDARIYEAQRRIAALMTVTDPRLRELRDDCIAVLRTDIQRDKTSSTTP